MTARLAPGAPDVDLNGLGVHLEDLDVDRRLSIGAGLITLAYRLARRTPEEIADLGVRVVVEALIELGVLEPGQVDWLPSSMPTEALDFITRLVADAATPDP